MVKLVVGDAISGWQRIREDVGRCLTNRVAEYGSCGDDGAEAKMKRQAANGKTSALTMCVLQLGSSTR